MDQMFIELLKNLGYYGIAVVVLGWVLKSAIEHLFTRDRDRAAQAIRRDADLALERVRAETDRQLEEFRHDSALVLEEHRVRFGTLHDRRDQVLADLHMHASDACSKASYLNSATDYLSAEASGKVCAEIEELCQSARKMLARSRLYLPEELVTKVEEVLDIVHNPAHLFHCDIFLREHELDPSIKPDYIDVAKARKLLAQVTEEFRRLLGTGI